MAEVVIIGCKLPNGILLEIGLQKTETDPVTKRPITLVKRTDKYKAVALKGWNAHNVSGLQMPHGMDTRPYLNRNIDKGFWEQWKDEHKGIWLIKNEILFEAKDEASAQLRVIESAKTPSVLKPIDVNFKTGEVVIDGKKQTMIETADFALPK